MPNEKPACTVTCDWPKKAEYILAALADRKMQQDRIEKTLNKMWEAMDSLKTSIVDTDTFAAKDRADLWKTVAVGETKQRGLIALVTFIASIAGGAIMLVAQHFFPI